MDESAAKLARKIAALLAKAESTEFEGEAASYMAKARELMEAHSIAESDVRDAVNPNSVIEIEAPYSSDWYKNIAVAGALYYGCQMSFRRTGTRFLKISLYGRQSGAVTASHMIPYLWREVVRSGNALRKGATPSEKRKAIRMVGDALATRITVQALAREGAAEELKEAETFQVATVPDLKTETLNTSRQTAQTMQAANEISIHLQTTQETRHAVS